MHSKYAVLIHLRYVLKNNFSFLHFLSFFTVYRQENVVYPISWNTAPLRKRELEQSDGQYIDFIVSVGGKPRGGGGGDTRGIGTTLPRTILNLLLLHSPFTLPNSQTTLSLFALQHEVSAAYTENWINPRSQFEILLKFMIMQ